MGDDGREAQPVAHVGVVAHEVDSTWSRPRALGLDAEGGAEACARARLAPSSRDHAVIHRVSVLSGKSVTTTIMPKA